MPNMADTHVPFVCSKCELATFSSLKELRFHLEHEHALTFSKPRNRVRIFNGFVEDRSDSDVMKDQHFAAYSAVPSVHDLAKQRGEGHRQTFDDVTAYRPDYPGAARLPERNVGQVHSPWESTFGPPADEDLDPPTVSQQPHADAVRNRNPENSFHTNNDIVINNMNSFDEQITRDNAFPSNLKTEENLLEDTVASLSNKVIQERISQQAAADSLYNAQEVIKGMEHAAEQKLQHQQDIIESLSQEVKEKEARLTTLTQQMDHLSSEQEGNHQQFSDLKEKLESENKELYKSMAEKEEEMSRLNEKIESLRLTFLKGDLGQKPQENNALTTIEQNTSTAAVLEDHHPTKEVSVSRICFSPENNDTEENVDTKSNLNNWSETKQEEAVIEQKDGKNILNNAAPRPQNGELSTSNVNGDELEKMKAKSKQLERDREHLLLDMQSLLTAAESDKRQLQEELRSQGDRVGHLHSDLQRCRREQTELLGETGALYGQANLYFHTLKSLLGEKEKQLASVSHLLDQAKSNPEMELRANQANLTKVPEKNVNFNASRQASAHAARPQNASVPRTEPLRHRGHHGSGEGGGWRPGMADKQELSPQKLRETVLKKEEKLKKYRQEWKNLQTYLQKTARKEQHARTRLEAFISHLLDRASRAESELSTLRSSLSDPHTDPGTYTESPRGKAKEGVDPRALPGVNHLVRPKHRSPDRSRSASKRSLGHRHSSPAARSRSRDAPDRGLGRHSSLQDLRSVPPYTPGHDRAYPSTHKPGAEQPLTHRNLSTASQAAPRHVLLQDQSFQPYSRSKESSKLYANPRESDLHGNRGARRSYRESPLATSFRGSPQYSSMPDIRQQSSKPYSGSHRDPYHGISPHYGTPLVKDKYGRPLFQNTSEVDGIVDNVRRKKKMSKSRRKLSVDEDGILWDKSQSPSSGYYAASPKGYGLGDGRPVGDGRAGGGRRPASRERQASGGDLYPKVTRDAMSSLQDDPLPLGEKIGKLLTSMDSEPIPSSARDKYGNDLDAASRSRRVTAGHPRLSSASSKGKSAPSTSIAPVVGLPPHSSTNDNKNNTFSESMADGNRGNGLKDKPRGTLSAFSKDSSPDPRVESPNSAKNKTNIPSDKAFDTLDRKVARPDSRQSDSLEPIKRESPLLRARAVQEQIKHLQQNLETRKDPYTPTTSEDESRQGYYDFKLSAQPEESRTNEMNEHSGQDVDEEAPGSRKVSEQVPDSPRVKFLHSAEAARGPERQDSSEQEEVSPHTWKRSTHAAGPSVRFSDDNVQSIETYSDSEASEERTDYLQQMEGKGSSPELSDRSTFDEQDYPDGAFTGSQPVSEPNPELDEFASKIVQSEMQKALAIVSREKKTHSSTQPPEFPVEHEDSFDEEGETAHKPAAGEEMYRGLDSGMRAFLTPHISDHSDDIDSEPEENNPTEHDEPVPEIRHQSASPASFQAVSVVDADSSTETGQQSTSPRGFGQFSTADPSDDETVSLAPPARTGPGDSPGVDALMVEPGQELDLETDTDVDPDSMVVSTDMATDTDQEPVSATSSGFRLRDLARQSKRNAKPSRAGAKHRNQAKKVRRNQARKLSSESAVSDADDLDEAQKAKKRAVRRRRKVLLLVFSYLDTDSLLQVAEVCKDWCVASRNPGLWRHVTLRDRIVSSQFLTTLSERCSQTESLTLKGLRGRGILSEEDPEEYAQNIRGSLEPGLERILSSCQDTITSLHIEDCDNILSDKCLWLISGYCRLLTRLTYRSALDPITGQLIWALGGGCPGVTSLRIQPLHPRSETNALNNHCLLLIGQFYSDLGEIGLGGKLFDMAGLVPLVQACQRLRSVHLESCVPFTEDVASALCRSGLKHLENLSIWGTSVEAKALEVCQGLCRQLKSIHIKMRLEDCVDDLTKKKEREKYKKMVKALEDLTAKPVYKNILKLEVVALEEKESGFFSFFSRS